MIESTSAYATPIGERLSEAVAMASPSHTGIIKRCIALPASATLAILILCSSTCSCLQFSYTTFGNGDEADFSFSPGSGIANGALQITPATGDMSHRSGRVCYARETLKLRNSKRTALTSFRTEFVLNIQYDGAAAELWIQYDGADVSVSIQYDGAAAELWIVATQRYRFVYGWPVDLSRYLTEDITVGFAASTGDHTELNQIKSWNFTTLA
ncbi:hypothetical protein BS78_06G200100 [Paspalum vaginatum]|nr:hypothetical protein BS78_06G200100 [Paspalum vaginatum]